MKYIAKIERGRPILFFPEIEASPGFIQYWTAQDGHGEACMDYYRGLKNPAPAELGPLAKIVQLYQALPPGPVELVRARRDSECMRWARWAWRANL